MITSDFITVRVRSYVSPRTQVEGFRRGLRFPVMIPSQSKLSDLAEALLKENVNEAGIMLVNGAVSRPAVVLCDGAEIDIFELIAGG